MTTKTFDIPAINIQHMVVTLIGDSPLIMHKWSEKAKQEILDKQTKKANKKKEAKDPEKLYKESMYEMPEGSITKYGFPAVGVKAAAVGACRSIDGLAMTQARSFFHIDCELVPIFGDPIMREDMVRIGNGVADIRFRGEFKEWYTQFVVNYNADNLSPEQLLNLFQIGGFSSGLGEWRPQKNGQYGRFRIATEEDINKLGLRNAA